MIEKPVGHMSPPAFLFNEQRLSSRERAGTAKADGKSPAVPGGDSGQDFFERLDDNLGINTGGHIRIGIGPGLRHVQ